MRASSKCALYNYNNNNNFLTPPPLPDNVLSKFTLEILLLRLVLHLKSSAVRQHEQQCNVKGARFSPECADGESSGCPARTPITLRTALHVLGELNSELGSTAFEVFELNSDPFCRRDHACERHAESRGRLSESGGAVPQPFPAQGAPNADSPHAVARCGADGARESHFGCELRRFGSYYLSQSQAFLSFLGRLLGKSYLNASWVSTCLFFSFFNITHWYVVQ